jgi:hypothetical protein
MYFIIKCLEQAFKTLDLLYNDIQFHHCDPKCSQLFLFKNKNSTEPICMLADLDKVTFTLNINDKPYHIRLTKDIEKGSFIGTSISIIEQIKILNKITEMRYEREPIKSNLLEKITFISSACILLNDINKSKDLRDYMLEKILKKYTDNPNIDYNKIIKLDSYYYSQKIYGSLIKKKSLGTAIKYVDYKYLLKYYKDNLVSADNLQSILNLKKTNLKNGSNSYDIYFDNNNINTV